MSPRLLPDVHKVGMTIQLTDEQLFGYMRFEDSRYDRKAKQIAVEPTPEVWARYYAAVKGFQALEAYEFTEWGGLDYGTEVPEPHTTYRYEYLETNEEWLARCRALRQEGIK